MLTLIPSLAHAYRNYDYGSTTMNQKDTGGYASNNFWNGSGDSKTEGVNNAMMALNCLAALDIGGAISHGYKGYGQYINSQRMDDLDSSAWNVKAALVSAGDNSNISGSASSAVSSGSDNSSVTGSTQSAQNGTGASSPGSAVTSAASHMLANMDHSFLYRGDTADIASQFEQKSGMSRETLFNELAAAEASGLSWNDPNLADKLEARYQSFVSKIPNQDYKAGLEKMHDMLDAAKKLDALEKAAAFYKENRWGAGGDKVAQNAAAAKEAALAAAANAAKEANDAAKRSPASEDSTIADAAAPTTAQAKTDEKAAKLTKEQMGMYLGLEGSHGDDLKDFLGPEETIFRVVSKRYRKLTPMMLGKI